MVCIGAHVRCKICYLIFSRHLNLDKLDREQSQIGYFSSKKTYFRERGQRERQREKERERDRLIQRERKRDREIESERETEKRESE